ncbi:hypothetical protein EDD11_008284 [Mortierella claussenii]|nr:hypothetical protein EDD11_008284 [Mortierella claussenii]
MRPPTTYEAAHVQAAKKSTSSLRLRPRRRSLIGRSRAVPFSAGALGSLRQRSEDDADDQLIVSLRDRNSVDVHTGAPLQTNGQALQEYLMVLTPQRLPYEIQMASGWDKGFPPEELVGLMRTSAGKGWHTPRFCGYPQDLVLRFSCGHSRIRKIQILSHQYKIASRLDFWMGSRKGVQSIDTAGSGSDVHSRHCKNAGNAHSDREDADNLYENEDNDDELDLIPQATVRKKSLPVLQFQKLGSISFDSNAASNYSGRELKSINVDVEGEYLRVVIRQCHVNPLNIYHQVAILALNVLGEPLEDDLLGESEHVDFNELEVVNGPGYGLSEASLAHSLVPMAEIPEMPNILDSVSALSIADIRDQPARYMDQEMQGLVSAFIKAKQDAVKEEDFASAKLYKAGYEVMLKFADEIQVLDINKQKAAGNDDFDLAQELKIQVSDVKARLRSYLSSTGFYVTMDKETSIISLTPSDTKEHENGIENSLVGTQSLPGDDLVKSTNSRNVSNSSAGTNVRDMPRSRKSVPSIAALNRTFSAPSDSSDPERSKRVEYSGKIPLPFSRSQSHSTGLSRQSNDARYAGMQSSYEAVSPPRGVGRSQLLVDDLRNVKDRFMNTSDMLNIGNDEIDNIHLHDLTEQERISFSVSLDIFSAKIVACLLSRELQHRLYALEYVKEHLENASVEDDMDQASDQNEIPSSVTYRSLEPIVSLLLIKASDLNTRVAQGTINRVVMLCNYFRASPYAVLSMVFKPARSTVLYRQSLSRIEIVARLVDEFGVYDRAEGKGTPGGLDFENITEFTIPYLSHTNGEVRVATRKLIIDVCKFLNKTRVEQFLPGVKPLIIEVRAWLPISLLVHIDHRSYIDLNCLPLEYSKGTGPKDPKKRAQQLFFNIPTTFAE